MAFYHMLCCLHLTWNLLLTCVNNPWVCALNVPFRFFLSSCRRSFSTESPKCSITKFSTCDCRTSCRSMISLHTFASDTFLVFVCDILPLFVFFVDDDDPKTPQIFFQAVFSLDSRQVTRLRNVKSPLIIHNGCKT